MKADKIREKIEKLLADNKDGDLKDKAFRDMLAMQILTILGPAGKGTSGATVLTESASMYNPKEHGPNGPRPESV